MLWSGIDSAWVVGEADRLGKMTVVSLFLWGSVLVELCPAEASGRRASVECYS
jgi:hypothetical protein